MRHSFYASDRNATKVRKSGQAFNQSRSGNYHNPDQKDQKSSALGVDEKDKILIIRINALFDKYKNDPETLQEIRSKLSTFEINRTIAREFNDKSSETDITREFSIYLSELEKRRL